MAISTAEVTPGQRVATAHFGAEALIQLLVANGVEYLFLNPGTDTAPIQEAIVSLTRQGERVPTVVPCLFENVAMAGAHGYFSVTRRPQAVIVHVDVGTQNLGGNMHNAMRGQGGVVVIAGRAPYTVDGTLPGSRDRLIQWQQDVPDQLGIARGYAKWVHELARVDTLHLLVPRAFQIAAAEPSGPVYMTIAREVLMAPADGVVADVHRRTLAPVTPAGDPAALRELAQMLADAERPVALTGRLGRHPEAVGELVALAELLGLPVVDRHGPMSFPSSHPLAARNGDALVKQADVLLLLDVDVPWIPRFAQPPAGARIAQIDIDAVKATLPLWGFPVDLPIEADTSKALPLLRQEVERLATPERRERWAARRAEVAAEHEAAEQRAREEMQRSRSQRPMSPAQVGAAIAATLPPNTLVVDESTTSREALLRYLPRDEPGSLITADAPGLGWALGAAVGAKLAAPERPVLATVGDGSFVFSSPIAALWAAQQVKAPFLTVVFNNAGYNASKNPVLALFPEGASQQENAFPGVRFPTPPSYAEIARACHAYGERVEDPAELEGALRRGWEAVQNGQAAVIDAVIRPI